MAILLHLILFLIIAVNVNLTIPVMLEPRFPSKGGRICSALVLSLICMLPIIPTLLVTYLLSFLAFFIYTLAFFRDRGSKSIAITMLFYSIISSCSVFGIKWFEAMAMQTMPLILEAAIAILLVAIYAIYFIILRQYVGKFADKSILSSFTAEPLPSPDARLGRRSLRRDKRHPWARIILFMLITRLFLFAHPKQKGAPQQRESPLLFSVWQRR